MMLAKGRKLMTYDERSLRKTNYGYPSWVAWGYVALAACLTLTLIAMVAVELTTRPNPTLPEPGPVPVNQSTLHLAPARVIPETKVIRVRLVDRDRFVGTLKKDVLAHGGWTEDPGNSKVSTIVAVVPEAYLERIGPLLQAEEQEGIHPNYVSWAKAASEGPRELADSAPVQVTFLVYKDTHRFSRKVLDKLFLWTVGLCIPMIGWAFVAMANRKDEN